MNFTQKTSHANSTTSWNKVNNWYNKITGVKGHYFHQHVVLPKSIQLLHLSSSSTLLDIGCGQGVLGRYISPTIKYVGVDIASNAILEASSLDKQKAHTYVVGDAEKSLLFLTQKFSHAAAILSLQNMKNQRQVINNIAQMLFKSGKFLIVLNHPCFRIPRQTSWEIDEKNRLQYRRINRYLSPLEIPITTHPGKKHSPVTWTFHHSLTDYAAALSHAGFVIEKMEEWISDKESEGKAIRMENRARSEFPLFLAILARKDC